MPRQAACFAVLFFFAAASIVLGQQDDPSEIFLKAYLSAKQAEKLEHQNRFKTALAKYRFAGSLIEELRKSHGDWQSAVVEYRGQKISQGILRLQERMTRQTQLNASGSPLPDIAPAAPESDAWSEPGPEVVAPQSDETVSDTPRDTPIKGATKKLRDQVNQLQAALNKTRGDLETTRSEKETVNNHLRETDSKLQAAQSELDETKKSEREARQQLMQVQESLGASASNDNRGAEPEQLRKQIAELKQAATAADQARATVEAQRDDTQAKLVTANDHIIALKRERDDAFSHLNSVQETQQSFQLLTAQKNDLQQKLVAAEENVRKLTEADSKSSEKLSEMEHQMTQLQQQLTDSEKSNQYLAARAAELDVELDRTGVELQAAKLTSSNSEQSAQLARENELLRNIVVRERQEEARRGEARKLVLEELDRLKVQSDVLNRQIEFLTQPVTKLTNEELALFRQPVVSFSNENPGVFKASFVFEKKSATGPVTSAKPDATPITTKVASDDLQKMTRIAHTSVEQGNYRAAEKQYQEILAIHPNNLDALCNLGVVYFRTGRIQTAESTLKRALAVAPNDDFALTTLGIVHYRQSRFDDALIELRKAIEINPNSATAHNYLGITASQKGRQEEAEKEILQAIAMNPNYADAHFNLAVILITTQPASKELAREHYARATVLGTQASPPLEKLLQ
ncbi:MAG TPA: tetratricopeptide repeat protein [Candidatus Udaeobacter sp.]|nr:tetratricopeptide repeat protein [Candidatus Udaeobacter sp.]